MSDNIQYICKIDNNSLQVVGVQKDGQYTDLSLAGFLNTFEKSDIPSAISNGWQETVKQYLKTQNF